MKVWNCLLKKVKDAYKQEDEFNIDNNEEISVCRKMTKN